MSWGQFAAAAVNAGASYYAANQASKAATKGGEQAAAGSEASNTLLREFYNRDEARNKPFYDAGVSALGQFQQGMQPQTDLRQWAPDQMFQMENGVPVVNQDAYANNTAYKSAWDTMQTQHRARYGGGFTQNSDPVALQRQLSEGYAKAADPYASFRNAPGYQFKMEEGTKATEASAAARGGLNSGATLKALMKYGQGVADQGYGDHMNRLASQAGMGQTASSAMGNAGQQYGGQMGQNMVQAGQARGNSTYMAGQAKQQGYADAGGFLNDAWGAYQQGKR